MNVKLLHIPKDRTIEVVDFEIPEITETQILIETIYCGVCRNDIAGYEGTGFRMPLGREGHETLGKVVEVGKWNKHFKVGDIVSTFDSDPGFSTHFISDITRAVKVPEISPNYILEPTACAVNVALKTIDFLSNKGNGWGEVLLIGSGYMSLIVAGVLKHTGIPFTVIGSSNKDEWDKLKVDLLSFTLKDNFAAVIDLSGKDSYDLVISKLKQGGCAVLATNYKESPRLNYNASSWNALTYIFPSPRDLDFLQVMERTVYFIQEKIINPIWSKEYTFEDAKQAFEDGLNRPLGYTKGYIKF